MRGAIGWLIVLGAVLFASSAFAQTTIEGVVHDASGANLPSVAVTLQRAEGSVAGQTTTDAAGKFTFPGIEAGDYSLKTDAAGFFPSVYQFTLRARQPLSLTFELRNKESVKQEVNVETSYLTVDPEKTGSSYTFTHQDLDALPVPVTLTTNDLVNNLMPGASDSHDNFLAVRGTEFSLHEFINGVSFLDNTQPQFSPGISPQVFEAVDLMTGGFTAEYGNRFGGVLDINTRSGQDLGGHGDIIYHGATVDTNDLTAEYGGVAGKLGYYGFVNGYTSSRFLDPPQPKELFDYGQGAQGLLQFDYHPSSRDLLKLVLMGGGDNFQQPNITDDQDVGRDAQRHLRQQTPILSWYHTFSPKTLLATSLYERIGSDRVLPTTDPITPLSTASRSPLTIGITSDLSHTWHGHFLKAGLDLRRIRENESFTFDGRGDPDMFAPFSGGLLGGQASVYGQDHFQLFRNFTVDAGVRYDYFDLVDTGVQVSPRVGLAYHIGKTKSVLHAAYNRYFSPPPIEYSVLASYIGNNALDPDQRVGNVRAYTQNYFEAGWSQALHSQISLEVTAYVHTGRNAFENHEISITRVFVPINFYSARSSGADFVLNVGRWERLGLSGRLQYAVQRTTFYGPITGGFAGDEPLVAGESITPAFDQTHTGTAQIIYNNKFHGFFAGSALRYGSGTIVENGPRLPQHFTADLSSGIDVWNAEPRRVALEFDVTNVSNSVYQIAKESEEIPIQYSPTRTVGGSLKFYF